MAAQTEKMSISINKQIKAAVDVVLTPSGFVDTPKGSYSALVNQLFQEYLEKTFRANILDILDYFDANLLADFAAAKQHFEELNNEN